MKRDNFLLDEVGPGKTSLMNKIMILAEGILVIAIGVLSLVDGIRLNKLRGSVLQYDVLGPGNYNVGIGLILIIVGMVYLIVSYIRNKLDGERLEGIKGLRKKPVILTVLILAAYSLLMNIVGYLVATLVFFFLINRTFGFRSWLVLIGLSVVMSVCFYVVFVYLLALPAPLGVLFKY